MSNLLYPLVAFYLLSNTCAKASGGNGDIFAEVCAEFFVEIENILIEMMEEKTMPDCWQEKWEKPVYQKDDADPYKSLNSDEVETFEKCVEELWDVISTQVKEPSPECEEYLAKEIAKDSEED